ncbi:MAG: stage III sporulation protein AE [Clostridiales bacterium]|nr:stage III sporulation protein AE [Clostridiales bacterium]
MQKSGNQITRILLAFLFCLLFGAISAKAEAESKREQSISAAEAEIESEGFFLPEEAESYLEIAEIEESLKELAGTEKFSFLDTVKNFLTGDFSLQPDELLNTISELFLGEIKQQRKLAVQILLTALASAVFSNFVRVFENHQISDISFYMMYLMLSTLLMNAFSSLTEMVSDTCIALNTFMKILMPSYVITVVLSAGTVTALGFYEVTVLAISLLQTVILKIVVPAIHFYMLVLLLNQLSAQDWLARTAQLMETAISWSVKTILGVVIGLQAVQSLISPAVDSLKNSTLNRVASVIPGIGSVLNAAAETVAGSAIVLKNAVGVAGILAFGVICLSPFVRLTACIFLFRAICAVIEPVCEKRMVEGIESISRGSVLLLRVMSASLAVFVISLAMITASVKGG